MFTKYFAFYQNKVVSYGSQEDIYNICCVHNE